MKKFVLGLSGAGAVRVLAVLMLGALALIGSRSGNAAAAAPTDSIAVTSPNNTTIAESDDYATQVLGQPWDMNELNDLTQLTYLTPPTINVVNGNGIWSTTTTSNGTGATIQLQYSNLPGTYSYLSERSGANYPIDSQRFTHLRFRMYSSIANSAIFWWFSGSTIGNSNFINTQAGWHVYDIDLTATGGGGGGAAWRSQATWTKLRLDPVNVQAPAGTQIQLDWIRLTPASGSSVNITWTASGSNPINLYLSSSPGGTDEMLIAANLPTTSRSYNWSTAGMAPGTYYIHAVMGGASSYSGALSVNQAPVFDITAPSPSSGEDFASTVLGYSWLMSSISQMQAQFNLTNITFNPGYMQASSPIVNGHADPEIWFTNNDMAHLVDTGKYHYMSYRLYLQAPTNPVNGQYAQENLGPRALWSQPGVAWNQTASYQAWYNRWLSVADDLRTVPLEPGYNNPGWSGVLRTFRFDPHEEDGEFGSGVAVPFFRLGDVRLTADPTVANGDTTTISWTPIKTGGNITLYYNTARTVGGTAIATVPLSQGGYVWPVSGLANGTYWISARADDGLNNFSQVAFAPLVVSGSHPCPATFADVPPAQPFYSFISDLYCRKIVSGYSDNTFRPNGIATRATLAQWIVQDRGWAINTTGGPHFADVPSSDPAYPFVETAYNHGVISGYADGTFHPDALVTRGQTSKMIVIAFGWAINTTGGPHFTDVPPANTFYQDIETIYNHGLISGYADHTFHWGAPLTRGQLSKILDLAQ